MTPSDSSIRYDTGRFSPARALLIGTLAVGVLDGLDAVIVFGLRSGASPARIFQAIASGALGPAAYEGGMVTALVGVGLHFVIACGIVAVYLGASREWPALRRRPLVFGPIYGVGVYFVMNLIVIPLSAIGSSRFTTFSVVNGLLIHVFGVGVPAALVAARTAWRSRVGRRA